MTRKEKEQLVRRRALMWIVILVNTREHRFDLPEFNEGNYFRMLHEWVTAYNYLNRKGNLIREGSIA